MSLVRVSDSDTDWGSQGKEQEESGVGGDGLSIGFIAIG